MVRNPHGVVPAGQRGVGWWPGAWASTEAQDYPGGVPRVLAKLLYWLAVLLISLALVVVLILFFESRDGSSLNGSLIPAGPVALHGG